MFFVIGDASNKLYVHCMSTSYLQKLLVKLIAMFIFYESYISLNKVTQMSYM